MREINFLLVTKAVKNLTGEFKVPGINGNGEKLTEICKEKIILRIIVGNKNE